MMNRLLISIILLLLLVATVAHTEDDGPWSVSATAPLVRTQGELNASVPAPPHEVSLARIPFFALLRVYKNYISPIDGDRCPMYPTCSQFCVQAINRHGLLIGIVMTSDRLMHEADERKFVPAVKVGNRYRIIDPVANNDFWWSQP